MYEREPLPTVSAIPIAIDQPLTMPAALDALADEARQLLAPHVAAERERIEAWAQAGAIDEATRARLLDASEEIARMRYCRALVDEINRHLRDIAQLRELLASLVGPAVPPKEHATNGASDAGR